LHRSKKDWEELMNSRRDLEKQTKELENQKNQALAIINKLERDVKTHREARKSAELAKAKAEKELAGDKERKEKKAFGKGCCNNKK